MVIATAMQFIFYLVAFSYIAGQSESNKALGLELILDDSVHIGDDFSAKASVTNKSSAKKYVAQLCCNQVKLK